MKKTIVIMVLVMVMAIMSVVPVLACEEEQRTAVSEDMSYVNLWVCYRDTCWTAKDGIISEDWEYELAYADPIGDGYTFTVDELNEMLSYFVDEMGASILIEEQEADDVHNSLATVYLWEDGVDPSPADYFGWSER